MKRQLWKIFGLPAIVAATVQAQPKVVLSGPATCRECRIELERVITLGDAKGPGLLQEQSSVATDRRGRFYLSSNYDPTVVVFDARGRFLRKLGRTGPGPGEFSSRVAMLIGPGDSLYAIELGGNRMSLFSPNYAWVRTSSLALTPSTAVHAPDVGFLFSGALRFADGIGHPVHVVDRNGAHIRSFGSATGEQDLYSRLEGLRRMTAPRGQIFWTSRVDAYVLEQWNLEGRKLAQLTRHVSWFPPDVKMPRGSNYTTHAPPPYMIGITEDSAGLVWTLAQVADRDWKPLRELLPSPSGTQNRATPDSVRHKIWDSVLEVIDPARGVVLVEQRFDTKFQEFIAPNLLVSFDEDADGNPRYVVWRARLVSPSK